MPINNAHQGRTDAGLYIRVSSEPQAEKVSPEIQEKDARKYCEMNGYRVVEVYRDIARYKVGKKMVEPSGTRLDRPEFQRMLRDARNGRINCIIAWKEDRLYRSFRPMLEMLDLLEADRGVRVELVKETFDMSLAPLKAWLAKMELKTKNDRWTMGMRGRLSANKVIGVASYGHDYDTATGQTSLNEEEAKWVYHIWKWYGDGHRLGEIHKALIQNGAPQKGRVDAQKTPWSTGVIRAILSREYYFTGKKQITVGDETFTVDVPPIIDEETYRRVIAQRKQWIAHRQPHRTHEYHTAWLEGILYCAACGWKMGLHYVYNTQRFIQSVQSYRCVHDYQTQQDTANCAGFVKIDWLDRFVWEKLWDFIHDPVTFERRIAQRIEQLKEQQAYAVENLDVLTNKLEALKEERRRVATMYRRNLISDDEMEEQLTVVQDQEAEITDSIAKAGNTFGDELERIQELSRLFRAYVADGLEGLDVEPSDPELFRRWSATVKGIVKAFVARVEVDEQLHVSILTHINLTEKLPVNSYIGANSSPLYFCQASQLRPVVSPVHTSIRD